MAEPQVDCVIPTHGRPDYLREALRSVLGQTLLPASITVVSDDGDLESGRLVAALGRTADVDLELLDRSGGSPGASASRNAGAERGRAPVLAFLDDDDVWDPSYLRRAVDRLVRDDVGAVVTATRRFSGEETTSIKVPLEGLDPRGVFRRNPGVTGSNIVLTRSAFAAAGGFDPAMVVQNDRDFFLRLLGTGATYAVETEPRVGVRQHDRGRLTDASIRRAEGIWAFDVKHGPGFSRWDRRTVRYCSHYTRMSAASTRSAFARSALAALANWSPTAGRDLPLDLLRAGRVQKLVKELLAGSW